MRGKTTIKVVWMLTQQNRELNKEVIYVRVKVKVMFTQEQSTKAQRGIIDAAVLLLSHRRLMADGGQSHDPATVPPGSTRYPL
jgi:hypothetical protein